MALDFNKFAWQKTLNMTILNLSTEAIEAYLTDLQTCNVTFNGTNVFATGSGGENLVSFGHTSTVDVEAMSGLFEFGALGQILGATPVTGATTNEVYQIEELDVSSDSATTTYTALGTSGSEIDFAYVVNTDGSRGSQLTQGAVVSSGVFTYTAGTKEIAFNSGEIADGGKVLVRYKYTTGASTVKLTKYSNVFSKEVKIILTGTVRETCSGLDYLAQCVIHKAKLTNELVINTSGTGDPSTMNVSATGEKRCNSNVMADIYIIDSSESS